MDEWSEMGEDIAHTINEDHQEAANGTTNIANKYGTDTTVTGQQQVSAVGDDVMGTYHQRRIQKKNKRRRTNQCVKPTNSTVDLQDSSRLL